MPPSGRRSGVCAAAFALAFLLRLAYAPFAPLPFDGVYWDLSSSLLANGSLALDGVRTTSYGLGYPAFLALARLAGRDHFAVVLCLQIAGASLGAPLLFLLAEALGASRRAAAIAALLFAAYPLLIRHAVSHSPLWLTTTMLVGFAHAFVTARTPARMAMAGVWLGLALLTRSATAPILVLALALLAYEQRWVPAAVLAATTAAMFAPFVVRSYALDGAVVPTRSGLNLFVGNSRYAAQLLPKDDPDLLQDYAEGLVERERPDLNLDAMVDEHEADRYLAKRAWDDMRRDPLRTLEQKAANVAYFFWPRLVPWRVRGDDTRLVVGPDDHVTVVDSHPRALIEELGYSVPYAFVLLGAVAGVLMRRRALGRDAILWCMLGTFVAVHAIYFPGTRYRSPVEFVLLFYAAVAADAWWGRAHLRRSG